MRLSEKFRQFALWGLISSIVLAGAGRILLCHTVYSPTLDEPVTVAAGIELIESGTYSLETLHPPLARVISAVIPYAYGVRGTGRNEIWSEGGAVFRSQRSLQNITSLSRIGNLLPFTIASFVVAIWAFYSRGPVAAIVTVFLFTTLPTILGHAGVATLDMSCAAFTTAALFSLWLWLENRTYLKSLLLGTTVALALLSKFPSILFLFVAIVFFVIAFAIMPAREKIRVDVGIFNSLFVVVFVCADVIWVGYGCSFHPLDTLDYRSLELLDQVLGRQGTLHDLAWAFIKSVPIPAPEFFDGLLQLHGRNQERPLCFMMGEVLRQGLWYYYPLRLLLKTPIAFLILTFVGCLTFLEKCEKRPESQRAFGPLLGALAILDVGMFSSVNNGIRQILAIYPLLALIAGIGCLRLWKVGGRSYCGAIATIGLLGWQAFAGIQAHPDYLPYFNELVAGRPERFAVDSDLDWSQDQGRMVAALTRLGAEDVGICVLAGVIDLDQFDPPSWHHLEPGRRVEGWVAISVNSLKLGTRQPPYDQYSWLEEFEPVERVGKSIFIYHIPKTVESKAESDSTMGNPGPTRKNESE